MTNKRLSEITRILAKNRMAGVKLTGKSAFEKELNAWISEPAIAVEDGLEPETSRELQEMVEQGF